MLKLYCWSAKCMYTCMATPHVLYDLQSRPPITEFSASGTSSDAGGQQLFWIGTPSGSHSEVTSWLQGAGTEPEPYPWPLWTNGKWEALRETKQEKKKKQSSHRDSKQLLLYNHKMSVSLIYTAAKASTFPKPWSSWLHSYGSCLHSINTHGLWGRENMTSTPRCSQTFSFPADDIAFLWNQSFLHF